MINPHNRCALLRLVKCSVGHFISTNSFYCLIIFGERNVIVNSVSYSVKIDDLYNNTEVFSASLFQEI